MTLDALAQAMRGMPRTAPIMLQRPDGSLADLALVTVTYRRADGTDATTDAAHGVYTIVLVPGEPP